MTPPDIKNVKIGLKGRMRLPSDFSLHLKQAVDDLMKREGTTRADIGFVDLKNDQTSSREFPRQPDVFGPVREWCARCGHDAAVWTALPSNFKQGTGVDFSVASAIAYLNGLPKSARSVALHYIDRDPEEVDTPLRRRRGEIHPL